MTLSGAGIYWWVSSYEKLSVTGNGRMWTSLYIATQLQLTLTCWLVNSQSISDHETLFGAFSPMHLFRPVSLDSCAFLTRMKVKGTGVCNEHIHYSAQNICFVFIYWFYISCSDCTGEHNWQSWVIWDSCTLFCVIIYLIKRHFELKTSGILFFLVWFACCGCLFYFIHTF